MGKHWHKKTEIRNIEPSIWSKRSSSCSTGTGAQSPRKRGLMYTIFQNILYESRRTKSQVPSESCIKKFPVFLMKMIFTGAQVVSSHWHIWQRVGVDT
jgi:hypothetical protein